MADKVLTPMLGTNTQDHLTGSHRSELIAGYGADDRLAGASGSDKIFGGSGNDIIAGDSGNDVLYGGGGPAIVDMTQLTIAQNHTGSVTFLDEGAGFRNSLGIYEIDAQGAIQNVQILFSNASRLGSGGELVPGQSSVELDFEAGDQIGFFIVSNGYGRGAMNQQLLADTGGQFELRDSTGAAGNVYAAEPLTLWHIDPETGIETQLRSQYGNDVFHSTASAEDGFGLNSDGFNHVTGQLNSVEGQLVIGFEDLKHGGDKDYDDLVFKVDIGQENAEALLPASSGEGQSPDDDVIDGGTGSDTIYGMSGDDRLAGGDGNDVVYGNSGSDAIQGNAGNDTLHGGANDDRIEGGSGDDVAFGNSGDDHLSGGSGYDELRGNAGDDVLSGGANADKLYGGSGDDRLTDGSGDDHVYGNSGNDYFVASAGSDNYVGGSGYDLIDFSQAKNSVKIDLHAHKAEGLGHDTLEGIEAVIAGRHDDRLKGDKRDNALDGGDGNDHIRSLAGEDRLTGGNGSDVFYYREKDVLDSRGNHLGRDYITDFQYGEDKIDFSSFVLGPPDEAMDNIFLTEMSGGTLVSVDFGRETGPSDVVFLADAEALEITSMVSDGTLVL